MLWTILLLLLNLCYASLEEDIKRRIEDTFGKDRVKVLRVKFDRKPEDSKSCDFVFDMEYGKFKSLVYLYCKGEKYTAYVDLLWAYPVFIAKDDIPKGTRLSPEMFVKELRYSKVIPSDLLISEEDINSMLTSTNILKGTVLRRSLTRSVPVVLRDQEVLAIYREGNLLLEFKAKALENGEVGKIIRIRHGEKILRAKVVGKGKVEVF